MRNGLFTSRATLARCRAALATTAMAVVAAAAMIAFAKVAYAQLPGVQLPNAQLPNLPRVDVPGTLGAATDTVNGTAADVPNDLELRRLTDLRRLRIHELLRTQRASVERDPNGAPVLRSELVAFSPSEAALESARAAGFTVTRERLLEGLDARLVVLRAPEGMSTRRALMRLRALDPGGAYDFNHIYLDSGYIGRSPMDAGMRTPQALWLTVAETRTNQPVPANQQTPTNQSTHANQQASASPGAPVSLAALATSRVAVADHAQGLDPAAIKLGLVDGGVDATHPVFRGAVIHQHGCGDKPVPSAHGTAVASLMMGRSEMFHGAAPGAELFAADVYCGVGTGGAVDSVVDGIAWLARQRVPVINVSLVGPPNVALENVVKLALARGFIIVAAVGNDGAAAPPLYPASYPGVVGVTGVDARQKALLEACRGPQVDFAAPGADMAAAMLSPSFATVRGTSFAAPLVAGLLAAQLREPSTGAAEQAIALLVRQAVDLGSRGFDEVYGNGLVGNSLRTAPALALGIKSNTEYFSRSANGSANDPGNDFAK